MNSTFCLHEEELAQFNAHIDLSLYNWRRMFLGNMLQSVSYFQDSLVDHREERVLASLSSLGAFLSRGERPQQ